jgi:hypothetical protein
MQLPSPTSSYRRRTTYGRYVGRKLRQAQHAALADQAAAATRAVKDAGRRWEDLEEDIQDALADRDAADERLDGLAASLRFALASRSQDAVKTNPYLKLFPQGLAFYTAAPLSDTAARYKSLWNRVEADLPNEDPLRAEYAPKLHDAIQLFEVSVELVRQTHDNQSRAHAELGLTEEAWEREMERIYGALMAEEGKDHAERYFPKAARR